MEVERYAVVHNDEEQFSIWPVGRALPMGWYEDGVSGTRDECLAYIERVWTDMRPKSLRSDAQSAPSAAPARPPETAPAAWQVD